MEFTPEDYADVAVEMANEKGLPIVVLGGDAPIVDALFSIGARFLHTGCLLHLVPALYVISTEDDRYAAYEFPTRSVVIDPFGLVEERPGIEVHQ
ncbi:hypothetical protein [Mycobacterium phage WXIN]|nr:hypothetical protein [Mycobacterium phage WXIN]